MIGLEQLAALAEAAYTTPPTFWQGDVRAVLTELPEGPVIAFRGTMLRNPRDWLRDFDGLVVWRDRLGWLHQGFITGAEAIWPGVKEAVAARPVTLVGHSLGGGLALDTAGLMAAAGMGPVRVVTFAAPRVGGVMMRTLLGTWPIEECVEVADEVPDLPPYLDHMARALARLGVASTDALTAHEIARYRADLPAYLAAQAVAA